MFPGGIKQRMGTTSKKARILIASVLALGGLILLLGFAHWNSDNLPRFTCYFALTLLSSGMKVRLPGITGSMSVAFLFALIGIEQLSLSENLLMVGAATVLQCTWHAQNRPKAIQVFFNVGSIAIAVYLGTLLYNSGLLAGYPFAPQLRMVVTAGAYFLLNTFPVAAVIAFTEDRPLGTIWHECYIWALPYYLVGAVIVCGVGAANRVFGWSFTVLLLPVMFLIHRSYGIYLGRLSIEQQRAEDQKKHAEDMASLHLRTIEALALAIEAKDHITHDHLRRVQVYALEIGKEMGLNDMELEALRAAALLHDIGKLAVPEHIISKPGKLTPEEFEKMKIHPVVGAEILERVKFPYPVVPIVCAHHEKWNGKGYPYGLKGEEIPLGARILAAVDCLDAIASDRQYRRGLPLDEAMSLVLSEAGKSYDPAVVAVLHRRYHELEQIAQNYPVDKTKLSTGLKIELGREPASGLELSAMRLLPAPTPALPAQSFPQNPTQNGDFLHSIAAARHEVQALFEMSQDLGNSLSLNETLSVLAVKLKRIIPHDSIAIYILREDKLIPEYVSGDDFRLFSSLEIPVGQGLSGWVADNRKSIINGNPSVEPGYLNDPEKFSLLRSALAVPLEGLSGIVGVLTLYHTEKDAFTRDHLRIVMALSSKVSLSIENALRFRQVECSATTDYLTGLPNARSLFLHLENQVGHCTLTNGKLAVLVCDLDGFKQVNDRFGHLEGNRVLQLTAKGIQANCRDCDYVARMGGDEFVMVLAGFEPGSLDQKVEQLSRMVAAVGREVCGEELLTLSVGAAFYRVDGKNPEELLASADRRMYKQKNGHRELSLTPAESWLRGLTATVQ
jgi:diguanylate cyclase (GGDEF)-like protein/putative nucleotidyltransferase with HDIG domain